jgi:hypothetical protein
MPDDSNESKKEKEVPKEKIDDLRKKIDKKGKTDTKEYIKQIATREKLERDYKEDVLKVAFYSSPETQRMILARRPTQKQMMTIMRLSAEAAVYEGKMDPDSLTKMVDIYDKLNELASELVVDKKLDSEFWSNYVSFSTLQNFISELVRETQKGTGVTSEELENFR